MRGTPANCSLKAASLRAAADGAHPPLPPPLPPGAGSAASLSAGSGCRSGCASRRSSRQSKASALPHDMVCMDAVCICCYCERNSLRQCLRSTRLPSAGGGPAGEHQQQAAASKGKQQAAQSAEAVRQLLEKAQEAAEAVRAGAEARSEQHREACDGEEAALRERVAAEAEASRAENSSIDLEWEQLQGVAVPQELHAGIQAVSAHCQRVLDSKDAMLAAARRLLSQRDEQYVRLLQAQGEETDALIAAMRGQQERCRAAQEAELEAVEAAYLQVRPLGLAGWVGWQS